MFSNPFPGLRFFGLEDTNLFFGREGQSDALLQKLNHTRFVAIVGTSGSGKSSLVRAGLLPALYGGFMASQQRSKWRVAALIPGKDPIGNLAWALNSSGEELDRETDTTSMEAAFTEVTLRRSSRGLVEFAHGLGPNENLLVVVDQFEELFRFREIREGGDEDAAALVKLLLEASRQTKFPIYVVLTMRSDFLGDCAKFHGLVETIDQGQFLIPRMSRDERKDAIEGPVAIGGAKITARLVNRVLNDLGDSPDQLPIMQHALMRTWSNWAQRGQEEAIDIRDYESIGGMSSALSLHAQEALEELPDNHARSIAKNIFKALVEKGDENRALRRPTRVEDLCKLADAPITDVIRVIENFRCEGRSFLTPPVGIQIRSDTIIDIAHESIIRNWDQLSKWAEEETQSARTYRRLADSATFFIEGTGSLLTDPALQLALDWVEASKPNAAWAARYHPAEFGAVMDFLGASRSARDAEREAETYRMERELRQALEISKYQQLAARRLRLLAVVLIVLLLLAIAMTVLAMKSRNDAMRSREAAIQLSIEADRQRKIAEEATRDALDANRKLGKMMEAIEEQNAGLKNK